MITPWDITHTLQFCEFVLRRISEADARAALVDDDLDLAHASIRELNELDEFTDKMMGLVECQLDPIETLDLEEDDLGSPVYALQGPGFKGSYYLVLAPKTGEGVRCSAT